MIVQYAAIYKYILRKKVLCENQLTSQEVTNEHCIRGKTLHSFNSCAGNANMNVKFKFYFYSHVYLNACMIASLTA